MSVQSRMPVSGRNARFEPDLIVQSTVNILKNGDSLRDTHFRNDTLARLNLNVSVRVGVRFAFKLLIQSERQLAEEPKKSSLSVCYT